MAKNMKKAALRWDERLGVMLFSVVAIAVLGAIATPASRWFEVGQVDVHNAQTWQEATVELPREINREFWGAWAGKIRQRINGEWVTICTTPLSYLTYQTDSQLPVPVTLDWLLWTEPQCYELGTGEYEITIVWNINIGSLLFERQAVRTDEFIIWGDGYAPNE